MSKLKKLTALLSAGILSIGLLGGCGTGGVNGTEDTQGAAENAKGRFMETEVELPEHVDAIMGAGASADGAVTLIGYDDDSEELYVAHSSNQGKDWKECKLDGEYAGISAAAVKEDGSVAVFDYFSSNKDAKMKLVAKDGSVKEVKLDIPDRSDDADTVLMDSDKKTNMICSAAYAAGKLFVTDLNSTLYEVDTESGKMSEFSKEITEDVSGIISMGEKLAVLTSNGVQLADVQKGTLIKEDTVLQKALGVVESYTDQATYPVMLAAGEKEDELYYVTHDGLFYHKLNGSTSEQLMNGELTSLGDGSIIFKALFRFDNEHYMVITTDSLGNDKCYNYAYDASVSAVPEKQLNVYALEDSYVLQQAVSAFQKKNPDVFVKKTIGMTGENGVTAEDAIKTLNTEIMAGNGPDVLVLDGLPVDSYVEKGVLTDVSSYVENADQKDGLFTNITDVYQKDGVIYQIPLRFFFVAAEGDSKLINASSDLQKLTEYAKNLKNGKDSVCVPFSAEMLLYTFYDAYSASWKTDTGIDSEALKKCLEAAKVQYDLDGYAENDRLTYTDDDMEMYQGQPYGFSTVAYGAISRLSDRAKFGIGTMYCTEDVRNIYGMEQYKDGTFGILSEGEKRAFVPLVSLGLAESAKDNKSAQQFIETALSQEGQSQMTNGFSVNRKAHEEECNNGKEYYMGMSDEDGKEIDYEVKKFHKDQIQSLTAMLESLNTAAWNDRVVEDLVINEGKKYLQNEQSLEDTVSAIVGKVQLYVSE